MNQKVYEYESLIYPAGDTGGDCTARQALRKIS